MTALAAAMLAGCGAADLPSSSQQQSETIDCNAVANAPLPSDTQEADAEKLVWNDVLGMTGQPLHVRWFLSGDPLASEDIGSIGPGHGQLIWSGAFQCTPKFVSIQLIWKRMAEGQPIGVAVATAFSAQEAADQQRAQAALVNSKL